MLILAMSIFLTLPSGGHFKLCFGQDGHFDIAIEACSDANKAALPHRPHDDGGHVQKSHSDCTDIIVACRSFDQLVRAPGNGGALKSQIKKDDPPATGLLSGLFLQKMGSIYPRVPDSYRCSVPPSHPDFLRTIVLII